ncbi:MAG: DNA-3-methyladenine glycosylase [Bacillota bacterium]|nr:DNA-3-methyladenine glycosylase [Bacillota bacterium]
MIDREFFRQDAVKLAPSLVGKLLVRRFPDGSVKKLRITETEAYTGTDDTACHAHKGKTPRSEMLWHDGGTIYVYLCYGMHNLINIVSGAEDDPQAVLIRCCEGAEGPGRLTKALGIDRRYNGLDIMSCDDLWLEDDGAEVDIILDTRVGIAYAEEKDRNALLRYKMR